MQGENPVSAKVLCCLCALHKVQGKRDETAAIKSSLPAPSSVKVEPSSRPIPSIKYEEPGEGLLSPQYMPTGAYRTTAYEPTQTLRDEMAQLNGSGLQGGQFLRFQCKLYVA